MSEMKRVEEAKEEALWWSEWAQDQMLFLSQKEENSFIHFGNEWETVFFWG